MGGGKGGGRSGGFGCGTRRGWVWGLWRVRARIRHRVMVSWGATRVGRSVIVRRRGRVRVVRRARPRRAAGGEELDVRKRGVRGREGWRKRLRGGM